MDVHKEKRRQRQRGASLLELTCAIFVIFTGAFGALQLQLICFDKTQVIAEYAAADRAIENEIETLRALPFAALDADEDVAFRSETPAASKLPGAEGRVVIAEEHDGIPGLACVTVRFAWTGEHGRRIQRQVSTLIADKE